MSTRTITRPYAIRSATLEEAQLLASAIVVDSLNVQRADLEALAQFVLELDTEPHVALDEARQAYAADGQRIHAANVEVHDLRNKLQGVTLRSEVASKAARETEKDLHAQLAAARQVTAELTCDLVAMSERADRAERHVECDDTIVVQMEGAA